MISSYVDPVSNSAVQQAEARDGSGGHGHGHHAEHHGHHAEHSGAVSRGEGRRPVIVSRSVLFLVLLHMVLRGKEWIFLDFVQVALTQVPGERQCYNTAATPPSCLANCFLAGPS